MGHFNTLYLLQTLILKQEEMVLFYKLFTIVERVLYLNNTRYCELRNKVVNFTVQTPGVDCSGISAGISFRNGMVN